MDILHCHHDRLTSFRRFGGGGGGQRSGREISSAQKKIGTAKPGRRGTPPSGRFVFRRSIGVGGAPFQTEYEHDSHFIFYAIEQTIRADAPAP